MKQKHTQARKARRWSGFRQRGRNRVMSKKRYFKRWDSIKDKPKFYGCQVVRVQRIFLKKDRFGAPIYKFVKHAAVGKYAEV